jgi:hypothetical protein
MGRKLEWELSGKSDVPQKMAQAKASMEGVEGAANALSKKFREAFKDIAVGFLAPMVLIQKAISFISDKIAQAKQDTAEARAFAKEEESRGLMRTGGREALLQSEERHAARIRQEKAARGNVEGYQSFLLEDPRGRKLLEEQSNPAARVASKFLPAIPGQEKQTQEEFIAKQTAKNPKVQAMIDELLAGEAAARAAKIAEQTAKETAGAAVAKGLDVGSNVVGVGMSPQLDIATKQLTVQEQSLECLRTLIERDQAATGFKTEKFWPSANRPPAR